jgi:uncharacterized protein YkwD
MRGFVVIMILAGLAALPAQAAPRDMSAKVLDLVNAERAKHGCPPLQIDAKLVRAAERQSRDMATQDFVSHTDPDGTTPGQRVHDTGYIFQMIGENIEAGSDTAEDAVDQWMQSPGHRANILTCAYRETGIAVYGLNDGQAIGSRAEPYRYYWTQVFAMPFR